MRFLVAVCTSLVLAAAATTAEAQFRPGHIGGVVKSDTGVPIRGAIITAQNKDATPPSLSSVSDEKGRFGLLGLRSGVWTVMFKAPGYEPVVIAWPVRSSPGGPTLDIVLVSIPGGAPVTQFDKVKSASVLEDLARRRRSSTRGRSTKRSRSIARCW